MSMRIAVLMLLIGMCFRCLGVTCVPKGQCYSNATTCDYQTGQCTVPLVPKGTPCVGDPEQDNTVCQADGSCSGVYLCQANNVTCMPAQQCVNAGVCSHGVCTYVNKATGLTCDDKNYMTVRMMLFENYL